MLKKNDKLVINYLKNIQGIYLNIDFIQPSMKICACKGVVWQQKRNLKKKWFKAN